MIGWLIVITGLALAALPAGLLRRRHPTRPRAIPAPTTPGADRRILFPFVERALSRRALDAALRLARAENATLVPVFLARVSLDLPLDSPIPRQSAIALPLQDAIEQRAAEFGIAVDARIERGRSYRHALRQAISHERFDQIVIAATDQGQPGFRGDDIAWLLDHAPVEIVVLRAARPAQGVPTGQRGLARPVRRSRVTRVVPRSPPRGEGQATSMFTRSG